jgi:DNA-binding NtrC family response regulator
MITWTPGKTLESIEREAIALALSHFKGNKTHAARALGICLRTLRLKIARYPELAHYRRAPRPHPPLVWSVHK